MQLLVLTSSGITISEFEPAFADQFGKKGSVLGKTVPWFLKLGDPSFLNCPCNIQSKYFLRIISFINFFNFIYFISQKLCNDWIAGGDGMEDCIGTVMRKNVNILG